MSGCDWRGSASFRVLFVRGLEFLQGLGFYCEGFGGFRVPVTLAFEEAQHRGSKRVPEKDGGTGLKCSLILGSLSPLVPTMAMRSLKDRNGLFSAKHTQGRSAPSPIFPFARRSKKVNATSSKRLCFGSEVELALLLA